MKNTRRMFSLSVAVLSGVMIVGCSGPIVVDPGASQPAGPPAYGLIDPQQAAPVIIEHQGDPNFVLLDVRTDPEIEASHISGAQSLDFRSSTFQHDLTRLDRGKTYLIYCRTGNRSGQSHQMMENLGFETIYDMAGGITDWIRVGYPVCQGPLDAEHTCSSGFLECIEAERLTFPYEKEEAILRANKGGMAPSSILRACRT